MKKWVVLLLFFGTFSLWSQDRNVRLLQGIIAADDAVLSGIEVVNLGNEKVTVTNSKGEFSILAKADDILVFSSKSLEMRRLLIDEDDLKSGVITVNMYPKTIELNEVIVKKSPIEGVSIIPGQKQYTPAERKLHTATSGVLDAPINWMSGRTAMLKKEVAVERKERLLDKIGILYEDKYYIETLKIPEIYIDDFQRYIIEDKEFTAALKVKNRTMMLFLISKLAVNYNAIPK
ncbi:MAG: carboxypeptidase-like regulatory domain-containing protein [Flavobacterium sp.]|jgi:hypothetical protein|nr:carboxypeptidase-like regulatory domain-containing protein [Flavobacterium sp.]